MQFRKLWIVRHPVITFLLSPFAALLLASAINSSGICIPEGTWLSDEEQIELAIETVWRRPENNYMDSVIRDGSTADKFQADHQPVSYESIEEFKRKNPDCCRVMGFYSTKPYWGYFLIDQLIGMRAEVVEIKYTARFEDKQNNLIELPNYTEYRVITNCGEVIVNY